MVLIFAVPGDLGIEVLIGGILTVMEIDVLEALMVLAIVIVAAGTEEAVSDTEM